MTFEQWYENEKKQIRNSLKKRRILAQVLKWIFIIMSLNFIFLELGSVYPDFTIVGVFIFIVGPVYLFIYYNVLNPRKPEKTFEKSFREVLKYDYDKEYFLEEINSKDKVCVDTHMNLHMQGGTILITKNFCYIKMPLYIQLLRNSDIEKVTLKEGLESLSIGRLVDLRTIYKLTFYIKNKYNQKNKTILFFFKDEDNANESLKRLSLMLNEGCQIENDIEFAKTDAGQAKEKKVAIIRIIFGVIFLIIYILIKILMKIY